MDAYWGIEMIQYDGKIFFYQIAVQKLNFQELGYTIKLKMELVAYVTDYSSH